MGNNVLAIVVTYNRKELLLECIDALLNQSVKCKILIVNNNSTDDTEETIKKMTSDELHYINTGANLGGAGGFNFGLKYGYENFKNDYFWIMDDDTIPDRDALAELLNAAGRVNNQFGFLSSKTVWTDGSFCKMNAQKTLEEKWIEDFDLIEYGMLRIEASTFVSCFFKREAVEKAGLPLKEFFIWNDDIEYTKRISKKYCEKNYFVGKSIVVHKMRANTIATVFDEKDMNRIKRQFYNYRNKFYLDKKYLGLKGFFKGAGRCIKYCVLSLFKGTNRMTRFWAIFKAFWAGIFFDPKVEYVNEK